MIVALPGLFSYLFFLGVYVWKIKCRKTEFSDHFSKIVACYKRNGYNIDVMKQSACSTVNVITVGHYAL